MDHLGPSSSMSYSPWKLYKVIFIIDADQIMRTDLKELRVNLHVAPHGYTPMGDDNEEM